jgi:hypothetical protein
MPGQTAYFPIGSNQGSVTVANNFPAAETYEVAAGLVTLLGGNLGRVNSPAQFVSELTNVLQKYHDCVTGASARRKVVCAATLGRDVAVAFGRLAASLGSRVISLVIGAAKQWNFTLRLNGEINAIAAGDRTITLAAIPKPPTGVTSQEVAALNGSEIDVSFPATLQQHSWSFASFGCQTRYDGLGPLGGIESGSIQVPAATLTYGGNLRGGWKLEWPSSSFADQVGRGDVSIAWAGPGAPAYADAFVSLLSPRGVAYHLAFWISKYAISGCPSVASSYTGLLGTSYAMHGALLKPGYGNPDAFVCGDLAADFPYVYYDFANYQNTILTANIRLLINHTGGLSGNTGVSGVDTFCSP